MSKVIYVVARENFGSGSVVWRLDQADAERHFNLHMENRPGDTLHLFALSVSASADDDTIGRLADQAMWSLDYRPLKTYIGTDGYVPGREVEGS